MESKTRKRVKLKGVLSDPDKILFMDYVYSLIPKKRLMLLKPHEYYRTECDNPKSKSNNILMEVTINDEKIFNRIKFEYIKWIKTDPDPEWRVADFECERSNGLTDFDKHDRLIEARKTRAEKQKEIDDDMELLKLYKKKKIEYKFLEDNLRKKIQRG